MTDSREDGALVRNPNYLHDRYPGDIAEVLVLRLAGVDIAPDGAPRISLRRALPFLAASVVPIVLAILIKPWHQPSPTQSLWAYFGWLAYFILLDVVTVLSAWFSCLGFYRITPDLDEALTDEGYAAYDAWAERNLSLRRQGRLMVATALLGVCALALADSAPSLHRNLYLSPASYIAVVWTAALASNCGHWLFHGTTLARHLTARCRIKLLWLAPARTPAIESLARVYRVSFYIASIGASLFLLPILTWSKGSGAGSSALVLVKVFLVCAAGALALGIAVIPQVCLSIAVIRERKATIKSLQKQLPGLDSELDGTISTLASLLKTVTDSPQSTINDRTIVALLLGLLAATLPGIVQLYLGL